MDNKIRKNFGEALKRARSECKLSLRDVERATGISNAHISQIENGKIKNPSFFIFVKLVKIYELDFNQFFKDIKI